MGIQDFVQRLRNKRGKLADMVDPVHTSHSFSPAPCSQHFHSRHILALRLKFMIEDIPTARLALLRCRGSIGPRTATPRTSPRIILLDVVDVSAIAHPISLTGSSASPILGLVLRTPSLLAIVTTPFGNVVVSCTGWRIGRARRAGVRSRRALRRNTSTTRRYY